MSKKRLLEGDAKEHLKNFLEKNREAIITAETETYKEGGADQPVRVYMFTPYSMAIAQANGSPNPFELISKIVEDFKQQEPSKMGEDQLPFFEEYGSQIVAILAFLPSTMVKIHKDDLSGLPMELMLKIMSGKLRNEDFEAYPDFKERFKKFYSPNILNAHFTSFYKNESRIFNIIEHNQEVLDMPLVEVLDYDEIERKGEKINGNLFRLKELIEVE